MPYFIYIHISWGNVLFYSQCCTYTSSFSDAHAGGHNTCRTQGNRIHTGTTTCKHQTIYVSAHADTVRQAIRRYLFTNSTLTITEMDIDNVRSKAN